MTIADIIHKRATAYPDRPAIIKADGRVTLYRDLELPEYEVIPLFTSGTTSEPRETRATEEQIMARVARFDLPNAGMKDCRKLFVPIRERAPAAILRTIYMLLKGGTILFGGVETDHDVWVDLCKREQVDSLHYNPKHPSWKSFTACKDYQFETVLVSGGKAVLSDVQHLGDKIYMNYGTAETGPIANCEMNDIPGCVGYVVPDLDVGFDGDMVRIRGASVVGKYSRDAALSSERFKDGWFYPGDRGHMEGDMLVVDGRW